MSLAENCTVRTPKFAPLASLIYDVCPDHNIEETVFGLNPGTFDFESLILNLGRGKIERESLINVTYKEVILSFFCKEVKEKTANQTVRTFLMCWKIIVSDLDSRNMKLSETIS